MPPFARDQYSEPHGRSLPRHLGATAADASFRRDARVIGLVGLAHALSHFFQLALPPLFPLLRAEFDVSWTLLGALVGVFYVASGVTQFAAGFAVDRFGARPVLLGGLALLAGGNARRGRSRPASCWLFPIVALMGVGNGVFHPADFAILNANVAPRRLGHAYSTHGIGGNLGYALAPIVSYGARRARSAGASRCWRWASPGSSCWACSRRSARCLTSHRAPDAHAHTLARQPRAVPAAGDPAVLRLLRRARRSPTVGLQTFAPPALNAAFDVPLALATSAVTAYLLGGTAGIVAGGFLAARTDAPRPRRRERACSPARAAGASSRPGPSRAAMLVPLFAAIGFAIGATGPSRDMIVRNATPQGAAGRVYGFVYSGLDLGATIGPVWFGLMLDHGAGPRDVLVVAALLRGRDRHRAAGAARARVAAQRDRREETAMDLGIAGRRALVCAASKGLGRGCAEALAREGVRGHDRRAHRGRRCSATADEIGAAAGRAVALGRVRHHDARGPRGGARRVPASPTSWSTTPAARRRAISATGTATRGSARSTPTC